MYRFFAIISRLPMYITWGLFLAAICMAVMSGQSDESVYDEYFKTFIIGSICSFLSWPFVAAICYLILPRPEDKIIYVKRSSEEDDDGDDASYEFKDDGQSAHASEKSKGHDTRKAALFQPKRTMMASA